MRTIGETIGHVLPIISVPASVGFAIACVLGHLLGDILITRDEIKGLIENDFIFAAKVDNLEVASSPA